MLRKNLDFLATLFFEAGIIHWAISPGSRNAPIVAGFIRHGGFKLHSFPDERCAAYAALGMAQDNNQPCGVLTTSGTAVLNLYPGICEAYYQRIPLVVLTADRPGELIDQWDGQTIHQNGIFEKHILGSFETLQTLDSQDHATDLEEMVFKAVNLSLYPVSGPVHINIPLRDPIYSELNEAFFDRKPQQLFSLKNEKAETIDRVYLHAELAKHKRILIIAGQMNSSEMMRNAMKTISLQYPVLADINVHLNGSSLDGWDRALYTQDSGAELKPDLLISFGLSFVSKSLKNFLKKHQPEVHWHISNGGFTGDPFLTSPVTKNTDPLEFAEALSDITGVENEEYYSRWKHFVEVGQKKELLEFEPLLKHEFETVQTILEELNSNDSVHLGNSMTVRYASWAGNNQARVFTNRGTSGIDGTLSTAVGYALANPDKQVYCVLGDIAFFYDSNALWVPQIPTNLGIVVLNNQGGAIFNFIDGPKTDNRLMPFVATPHHRTAAHIAGDYNVRHLKSLFTTQAETVRLIKTQKPFILEITHDRK